MSELKNKRTRLLQVRMTPVEYQRIQNKFSKTTCRKLSEYIRKVLLDKPIKVNSRNQSFDDFVSELGELRKELSSIGNNYNQTVKRLHMIRDFSEIQTWLLLNENSKSIVLQKISEIKLKMDQINEQWLQL